MPLPNPLFTFAVKKNVAPFACDLSACIAQAGLQYCIIFLSCPIKLLGFASLNPTYTTILSESPLIAFKAPANQAIATPAIKIKRLIEDALQYN